MLLIGSQLCIRSLHSSILFARIYFKMHAWSAVWHGLGQGLNRSAILTAQMVVHRIRGRGDQPALKIGLWSLFLLRSFKQAHKDIARDIFGGCIIIDPVTDITIDFREKFVVDSTYGLRI